MSTKYIGKNNRIWTEKSTLVLREAWPHWGSEESSKILGLTQQQVKSKADFLKLKMLPKKERKCISCETGFQEKRAYGMQCRSCFLEKRKIQRLKIIKPTEVWMKELLRTMKYRSKTLCDINVEYMLKLWEYQNKRCIYTNLPLREPSYYGHGRHSDTASVDRIDSSIGYVKGNIAWCCWGCNIAKSDFSLNSFIKQCQLIVDNTSTIFENINGIQSL